MLVSQIHTEELAGILKKRYPRWSGLSDERFTKDDIGIKRETLWKAKDLLDEASLRHLLKERRFDEMLDRIQFLLKSSDLGNSCMPGPEEADFLGNLGSAKSNYCTAFVDLLYGSGKSPARFQRYVDFLQISNLPSTWAFPTFFLMMCHPDKDFFVKTEVIRWFLKKIDWPLDISATPSGATYKAVLLLARELDFLFENGKTSQMSFIFQFVWVCYISSFDERDKKTAHKKLPQTNGDRAPHLNVKNGRTKSEFRFTVPFRVVNLDRMREISDGVAAPELKSHPEAALTDEVFTLLKNYPKDAVNNRQYEDLVEKPFQALVKSVISQLPDSIRGYFFSIPMSKYGTEQAADYYMASFYRKGGKWRGEPQLYILINGDSLECGYAIEWYVGDYLEKFLSNFKKNERRLLPWIQGIVGDGVRIRSFKPKTSDDAPAFQAESFVYHNRDVRIAAVFPKEQVSRLSKTDLNALFINVLTRLFPLLALAIDEKPQLDRTIPITPLPVLPEIPVADAKEPHVLPLQSSELHVVEATNDHDEVAELQTKEEAIDTSESEETEAFSSGGNLLKILADEIISGSHVSAAAALNEKEVSAEAESIESGARETKGEELVPVEPELTASEETSAPTPTETAVENGPNVEPRIIKNVFSELQEMGLVPLGPDVNPSYPLQACAVECGFDQETLSQWMSAIERKGQAVFYGPSGTGKTFMAEKIAQHLTGGQDGFIQFIQFHPGMTYDDFIQSSSSSASFKDPKPGRAPGRLLEFCREAERRTGTCVLILDEIHRADLDRVLGEILYALEYRGREISLSGGGRFKIPANVRIIGTMNTATGSMIHIDPAMRRRFAFLELGPRMDVLRRFHAKTGFAAEGLIQTLENLNRAIGDKRVEVGITAFLRDDLSMSLQNIWQTEIEPHIQAHFSNHTSKANEFSWSVIGPRVV